MGTLISIFGVAANDFGLISGENAIIKKIGVGYFVSYGFFKYIGVENLQEYKDNEEEDDTLLGIFINNEWLWGVPGSILLYLFV